MYFTVFKQVNPGVHIYSDHLLAVFLYYLVQLNNIGLVLCLRKCISWGNYIFLFINSFKTFEHLRF